MERELPGKTVNHTKVGLNNGLAVIKIIYVLPVRYFTLIHYAASRRQLWLFIKVMLMRSLMHHGYLPISIVYIFLPAICAFSAFEISLSFMMELV